MRTLATALVGLTLAGACRTAPPATPTSPFAPTGVETFELESRALGEVRRLAVYTPPGYAEDPARTYPLLVLPDGGLQEDFPHVAEAVHFGVTWGLLQPMLIVGIENTERRRDLTGPTEIPSDLEVAPHAGGSARFRAFLRDELLPEVRRRYRVGEGTAIMGESLAGWFVLESLFLEPELFDTWIAFSPSLWWSDRDLVRRAEERLRARPASAERLYLTSADEADIVADVEALTRVLAEHAPAELEWSWLPLPHEFHDTIYRASAPRALRVLFPAPAP
jgi:predicted alpha/beta superfamily hydrolase